MFKKHLIIYFIISLTLTFVFAQNEENSNPNGSGAKVIEAKVITDETSDNINGINLMFCNNGEENLVNNFTMPIKQGEKKEVCLAIINSNSIDSDILINFAPGIPIDIGGRGCSDVYSKTNGFADFIQTDRNGKIRVPANGSIIKKISVQFPIGVSGLKRGCVAYAIAPVEKAQTNNSAGGNSITLNIRKISLLNFLVSDLSDIKGKIDGKISYDFDNNKNLNITMSVKNNFPIDETIDISGSISNIFGYKQEFKIDSNNLAADGSIDLKANVGQIPRYKGPFKIEIITKYKPYFQFDISNSGIDPKILEEKFVINSKTLFIFPTIPVIGFLIFILLMYFAFFKKPKVIIQQIPTAQPQ